MTVSVMQTPDWLFVCHVSIILTPDWLFVCHVSVILTPDWLFQVDMVQIKLCYKDLFKKTCKEAIDDDTSGTYGDLLLALVGPGP